MTAPRYPGSKWKLSRRIVPYIPHDAEHYFEPFLGLGYVFKRLMLADVHFATFRLSDLNRPLVNFHLAVQGDKTYGDIFERVADAHQRMLPESEHEREICAEWYRCRERLRYGDDPYDWMFVMSYAVGQYCGRFRKNIASFYPGYLRGGIKIMTMHRLREWQRMLQRAEISCCDALALLRQVNQRDDAASCFFYLDPTYIAPNSKKGMDMYDHELTVAQHLELAAILKAARFRFILSIGDAPLARKLYIHDESFRSPFREVAGFYAVRVLPSNSGRRKNQDRKLAGTPEWLVMNYDRA